MPDLQLDRDLVVRAIDQELDAMRTFKASMTHPDDLDEAALNIASMEEFKARVLKRDSGLGQFNVWLPSTVIVEEPAGFNGAMFS